MYGPKVHHIQIAVQNGREVISKLVRQVEFKIEAEGRLRDLNHWVLRNGNAVFLVTEKSVDRQTSGLTTHQNGGSLPLACLSPFTYHKDSSNFSVDTVFNIALQVPNVPKTLARAREHGAEIVCDSTIVRDGANGEVTIGAVKSCVGNIVHTVLDVSNYKGNFLPGFTNVRESQNDSHHISPMVSHFDHVTFACNSGTMDNVIDWYSKCLGMKRFKVNRNDDDDDGMVIVGESSGLKLKAMDYWKCAEEGLKLDSASHSTSIILAEGIKGSGPNQIETFLREHGGEGIQHIGLYTPDIFQATKNLTDNGLDFMQPPEEYYSELKNVRGISILEDNIGLLRELNILLDTEEELADGTVKNGHYSQCHFKRYLMQVFSKPIFDQDTFFLELIQREGARGFGAGNIRALWQAVAAHMAKKENQANNP